MKRHLARVLLGRAVSALHSQATAARV
jgi:hypothetical protein